MKLVFRSFNVSEVGLLQSLFEQEGIESFARNVQMSLAAGSVPFLDVQPELWILKDEDEARALQILEAWKNEPQTVEAPWVCPQCGETNEGQFGACWKCGYLIDG